MAISFQLDPELETRLRGVVADLDQTAKEATLVNLYRRGQMTHAELADALGLDRFETESLLGRYGVTEDLPTAAEVEADRQLIDELLEKRA